MAPLVHAAVELRGDAIRKRSDLTLDELPLGRPPAIPPQGTDSLEVLVSAAAWARQAAFDAAHTIPANGAPLPLLAVLTQQMCSHAADLYEHLYAAQLDVSGWWKGRRDLLFDTAAAHRNAGRAWLTVLGSWATGIRPLDRPSVEVAYRADAFYQSLRAGTTANASDAETLRRLLHDGKSARDLTAALSRALTELADAAGHGMRALITLRANRGLAARTADTSRPWKICRKDAPPPTSYITALARYARAEQATLTAATHAAATVERTGAPAVRPSLLRHVSMGSDRPSLTDLLGAPRPSALGHRRTTALDVLAVLAKQRANTNAPTIARRSGHDPTTVYRILTRLEEDGWVESWLSTAPGPRRRFYRLHPEHVGAARTLLAEARHPAPRPNARPRQHLAGHDPTRKPAR